MYQDRYWHDNVFDTVDEFVKVADSAGIPLPTLAVAWTLANPAITSPIVGASRPGQLDATLCGLDTKLEPDLVGTLNGSPRPTAGATRPIGTLPPPDSGILPTMAFLVAAEGRSLRDPGVGSHGGRAARRTLASFRELDDDVLDRAAANAAAVSTGRRSSPAPTGWAVPRNTDRASLAARPAPRAASRTAAGTIASRGCFA